MSPGEKRLAAHLLRLAAEQFSNHGCNDFDLAEHCADPLARDGFVREFFAWNGDPDEYYEVDDNQDNVHDWRLGDDALMSFLAARLEADDD